MSPKTAYYALVAGLALLGGTVVYYNYRVAVLRDRFIAAALRSDSLEATSRTTERLAVAAQKRLGDSLSGFVRRVVQAEQKADALDKSLRMERLAKGHATVRVDSLHRELQGLVEADSADDVRTTTFQDYRPPYTIAAEVAIPKPPMQSRMLLRVGLDPIPMQIRMWCGKPNPHGIKPAHWMMTVPRWATLSVDSVFQDPTLCRSPALVSRPKRTTQVLRVAVLVLAAVKVVDWLH